MPKIPSYFGDPCKITGATNAILPRNLRLIILLNCLGIHLQSVHLRSPILLRARQGQRKTRTVRRGSRNDFPKTRRLSKLKFVTVVSSVRFKNLHASAEKRTLTDTETHRSGNFRLGSNVALHPSHSGPLSLSIHARPYSSLRSAPLSPSRYTRGGGARSKVPENVSRPLLFRRARARKFFYPVHSAFSLFSFFFPFFFFLNTAPG